MVPSIQLVQLELSSLRFGLPSFHEGEVHRLIILSNDWLILLPKLMHLREHDRESSC